MLQKCCYLEPEPVARTVDRLHNTAHHPTPRNPTTNHPRRPTTPRPPTTTCPRRPTTPCPHPRTPNPTKKNQNTIKVKITFGPVKITYLQ